jgi:hypothetical protein
LTEIVAALQALMTDQSLSFGEPWACLRTFNAWFYRPPCHGLAIVDPYKAHARDASSITSPSGVPQMAFFTAASKADFQHQLQAALAQHISEQALPQVALFAEQFFGIISLDELTQRRLSDLAGCTLSAWRLLERFDHAQPQVRVYNPDYERHGWQSTHTAVEVLHHDLPFLVDSVRTELNRRGYSIHTLQTTVLSVRRGSKGELLEILPGTQGEACARVADVPGDRPLRQRRRTDVLSKELEQVLAEVRVAVADFEPMKAKVRKCWRRSSRPPLARANEKGEIKPSSNGWWATTSPSWAMKSSPSGRGRWRPYRLRRAVLPRLTKLLRAGLTADDLRIEDYAVAYLREPTLLSFAKAAHPSRVHRPAYPDYVSIRQIDADGKVIKECRFMGLYTSSVYGESVRVIPYIRARSPKSNAVRASSQGPPGQGTGAGARSAAARRPVPDPGRRAVQHRDVDRADPGTQQDPRVPAQRPVRPLLLLPGLRAARHLFHRSAPEDPAGADGAPEGHRLRVLDLLLRIRAGPRATDSAGRPEEPHRHRPAAAGKRSGAGLPLWQDDYSAWWWKASAKPTAPTCWRTSRKASRPVTASASPRIRRWSTCSTC